MEREFIREEKAHVDYGSGIRFSKFCLFFWWFVLEMNGKLDHCWMIGLPIIEK